MIADLRINKTSIVVTISALIFILGLTLVYSNERDKAYAKLNPYAISFVLDASAMSDIVLAYDYGYGVNNSHQRAITQMGDVGEQTYNISLSSWKRIRYITFISPEVSRYELKSFTISRADNKLKFDSNNLERSAENGNIVYRLNFNKWAH